VVLADGALHYVPFAALISPTTAEPLIVGHEIISLPSASVLAALRRQLDRRPPAPGSLAMVADPVFRADDPRLIGKIATASGQAPATDTLADPELSPIESVLDGFRRLPFSRREAETVLAMVPEATALKALGLAANRATVTSGQLAGYRMVHFATHGLLNASFPELSGIVLSMVDQHGEKQDGYLRAYEIYDLDLQADLVVVSACRTALGKAVRGEGIVGLTHAFFSAGAARVVVSLWNVNDLGSAELMRRFYQGILQEGLRPAAALRAAQISMITEPQWSAPYYWAGFTFQGEWR
jgi:CHAT domain-containing protein